MNIYFKKLQKFILVLVLSLGLIIVPLIGIYEFFENMTYFWTVAVLLYIMAIAMLYSFGDEETKY